MTRSYANAAAFRQALETRLRNIAQQRGVQIQGLRLKVAIERLLARLFHEPNPPWLLKGGYAMELRFRPKARTTRDLDLTLGERARGNQWCLLAALALPGSGCHEVASNRHPSHICQQRH